MLARFIQIALIACDWMRNRKEWKGREETWVQRHLIFFCAPRLSQLIASTYFFNFSLDFLCSFDLLFHFILCRFLFSIPLHQPINIYWYRKYNRLPFMYLCTRSMFANTIECVCVFFFLSLSSFSLRTHFISSIRFNLSWMKDTWKMKNDYVYRISFDDICLSPPFPSPFVLHFIFINWT